jgi:hypothetical protein
MNVFFRQVWLVHFALVSGKALARRLLAHEDDVAIGRYERIDAAQILNAHRAIDTSQFADAVGGLQAVQQVSYQRTRENLISKRSPANRYGCMG